MIAVRITARDYRTIRNYNSGILSNRCNLRKIKLSSNASYTYQELNKHPIPSIMEPRKSKRPECIRVPNYNSLIPSRRTVTFPHFPKICFSNVRSMVNKIDEIVASISTNLYDVVVITVYCSFIRPVLEYACPVWHTSLPKFLIDELEHIQKRALKIIVPHLSYSESLIDLKLPTLEERRELLCRSFYENNYSDTSSKISHLLPEPLDHQYRLRHPQSIPLFNARTKRYNDSFLPYCVRKWNSF